MTGIKLTEDFNRYANDAYNDGVFTDQDGFYEWVHQYVDDEVIYTHHCKEICEALNYDIFEDHDIWGKAENWSQAAYACLYDHIYETGDTFDDIEYNNDINK